MRAALQLGDSARGRERRTSEALGVRVCRGRTGALPPAPLKAEATTPFPPVLSFERGRCDPGGSWHSR